MWLDQFFSHSTLHPTGREGPSKNRVCNHCLFLAPLLLSLLKISTEYCSFSSVPYISTKELFFIKIFKKKENLIYGSETTEFFWDTMIDMMWWWCMQHTRKAFFFWCRNRSSGRERSRRMVTTLLMMSKLLLKLKSRQPVFQTAWKLNSSLKPMI